MIVLNLKTYQETLEKSLLFADIASEIVEETGVRIIVCPPSVFLKDAADRFSDIYAQHVDSDSPGPFTGSLPVDALKQIRAKGSLVNHSEKRIRMEKVRLTVDALHAAALESLVCGESPKECAEIAAFSPTFIAVEPPELIGRGVSVSNAKPDVVINTVAEIRKVNDKTGILCGAGVSNPEDAKNALRLGAEGVLLASAFVKSPQPKAFLRDLAGVF